MYRLKKLLLTVLIAVMALGLSLGIAACGGEKTVSYTVTVTCEDASVLGQVKVQLKKDTAESEEKALTDGKATFELEAGTYTVVLTGVPEAYTYEQKSVTESAPSATVALTKKDDHSADGLVSYTVNVTCEDKAVLSGVKVVLMLGSVVAEEKPLTDGTATFKLQPGDYTVTLTGVPAGYTYEPKTISAPGSTVTIALTATAASSAVDITVKVPAGKDVFGADITETALKNAKVELYRSETDLTPAASATTDGTGVAHFETLAAGSYLASVNGQDCGTLSVNGATASITLNEKLGSAAAPIAWTVGENNLPFTEEVLTSLGDAPVYCSLVVGENGLYSFDADNYNVNVTGDLFEDGLIGSDTHIAVTLTAGTVYTFECTSTGALAESGQFGYEITVTKGDTKEGGDAPNIPWTGSGTEADPYLITALKSTYRVQIKYENGAYVPVYFKYTETAAANYAIYSSDQNFFMMVGNKSYMGGGDASSEQSLFTTEAGKSYVFVLSPYDDEGTADVTVSFTIGDFTGYLPKWEGSGKFSSAAGYEKDDPFLVTTLVDSYEVHGADRVYFKYAATETKNYTVTLDGTDGFDFWLRNYNNGKPDSGKHYTLSTSHKTAVVSLTASTTYLFGVMGGGDGLDGNNAFVVNFTITEGGTPETENPEEPGDGSANKPFKIENILGDNKLALTSSGSAYYTFTAPNTGTYTFTAQTTLYLSDFKGSNGSTLNAFTGNKVGATKDYELIAGIAYTFNVRAYGGASASEVTLKVELKAEAPAVTLPDEFNGNWQGVENDYSLSITGGNLTVKKNGTPIESIVTSQASTSMAGKTSYYVTFEGKTYTLQWDSAGEKMLQLYLNSTTALYFVPDSLPSFAIDADLCGEYADREGKLPDHIVVSANGITWANHTVVLVSDMTTEYPGYDKAFAAYVDGKPELVMFGNDSIYFQKAKIYFDSVKEGTITLPEEFLGNWKSADGKYTLEVTATSVTLKENGTAVSATLNSKKVGSTTEYTLTFEGTEWTLVNLVQGVLTLQGETNLHFAKDPLPTVDLTQYVGVYRCSLSVDYLEVKANAIVWGKRTVSLAGAPSVTDYGTGYPFFADGKLYLFFVDADDSLLLMDNDGGEDAELTKVGDTVPEADGSETKPYVLENFLGDHTMQGMTSTQTYYVFELPFPATLTFTAKVAGFAVYINGSAWAATSATSKTTKTLSGVVTLGIQSMSSTAVDASFTISLNYTVTVKGADKDVYGNTLNEKGKSGVTVTLMKGTQTAQTATTNASGVATFLVTDLDEYTAKVDDDSYLFTNAACDVTLFSETVIGSSPEHPLTLVLGANEFNLSEDVMEQAPSGICYVFECTYSGTYAFTLSEALPEAGVMFMLTDGAGGGLNLGALGGLTGKIALEKGKTYTAMLAGGAPVTLTIGLDLGDVEGAGTKEDPEVLKTLDSVFRYVGLDANSARYFRFVLDKNYAITIKASKNCTIGGALVGSNQTLNATGSLTAVVKKNTPVDFFVYLQKNVGEGYLELTFTGTETPDIPFGGSGTQTDPYKPDNLAGEYELYVTQSKYVYFEYTATKDTTYKVTFIDDTVPFTFYLPAGTLFQTENKNSLSSSKGPDTFYLPAGTKLTLRLFADKTGIVKFKIEEVTGV